jgi:hypothetical protein
MAGKFVGAACPTAMAACKILVLCLIHCTFYFMQVNKLKIFICCRLKCLSILDSTHKLSVHSAEKVSVCSTEKYKHFMIYMRASVTQRFTYGL